MTQIPSLDDDGDKDWLRHLEGSTQQQHRYVFNDDVDCRKEDCAAGTDETNFSPTSLKEEMDMKGNLRTNRPVGGVPFDQPRSDGTVGPEYPLLGGLPNGPESARY